MIGELVGERAFQENNQNSMMPPVDPALSPEVIGFFDDASSTISYVIGLSMTERNPLLSKPANATQVC
jgi:hypothetical protein